MENLESIYPTDEQIKEALEAYRKGGDALMDLIKKRRQEHETTKTQIEQPDSSLSERDVDGEP